MNDKIVSMVLLGAIVVGTVVTTKFFEQGEGVISFVFATAVACYVATIFFRINRDNKKIAALKQEAVEDAGFIIGLKRLPAGTYEVLGTLTYKADGSSYGHIVRNVRTDRHHCVSHYRELPDMFVIDPNGEVYNGSRQSREEAPLRGVVG